MLANKLNLQLIYNDLNSPRSSCTLISEASPSGFPSSLVPELLCTTLLSLSEAAAGPPALELHPVAGCSLCVFFLEARVVYFLVMIMICLIRECYRVQDTTVFILLSACLFFSFLFHIPLGDGTPCSLCWGDWAGLLLSLLDVSGVGYGRAARSDL